MYHCLKYNDDISQMKDCWQLKEDGHCLYCPLYQSDEQLKEAQDGVKKRVLEKIIETANIALKKDNTEMRYKVTNELREFNKDFAHAGDMYFYQGGKLLYMGNTCSEPVKSSLWKRIKRWFNKIRNHNGL